MKKTKEKGVTLIALVITIVILLIISSIGITTGISTINYTKFSQFENELKILQTKVNELNQNNEINIGQELIEEQKNLINKSPISDIIYNGKSEEEKLTIQKGFRYLDSNSIKNDLQLESIKRTYLINFEYRYVICYEGFEYDGTTYYMINQIDDSIYNVTYNNKNPEEGDFEVLCIKENDKWKIEVSNIIYDGYISNWKVKYRLDGDTYWKTSNKLSFYVAEEGNYYVQVVHGDEINLGSKLVTVIDETEETNELSENITY